MDDIPKLYTSGDARRLVGITRRELEYWDEKGLVQPHGRPASGRGSRRLYMEFDIVQLKTIRRLRARVSLQKIRRAFSRIADLPDGLASLAELEVITDGQRILIKGMDEDAVIDALTGQYMLRIPLAELLAEVREGIESPFDEGEPSS